MNYPKHVLLIPAPMLDKSVQQQPIANLPSFQLFTRSLRSTRFTAAAPSGRVCARLDDDDE